MNGVEPQGGLPAAVSESKQIQSIAGPREAPQLMDEFDLVLFSSSLFFEQWAAACLLSSIKEKTSNQLNQNQFQPFNWAELIGCWLMDELIEQGGPLLLIYCWL